MSYTALTIASDNSRIVNNALAGKAYKVIALVRFASFPGFNQQLSNRVFAGASKADGGTNAIALDQTAKDLSAFFGGQLVHSISI